MRPGLLRLLVCPTCGANLVLEAPDTTGEDVETARLACRDCHVRYDVERGIPRFVPPANYAASFGFQWNQFRRTQLDSFSGLPISRARFFRQSRWRPQDLQGATVLDAGCGAGRFAEIALSAGATVVAVDYSDAVDACRANLSTRGDLHAVQADIYHPPFAPGSFDVVYSFGVLQHTPDPARAFRSLVSLTRSGGCIAVDLYPATPLNLLWPKYWLRPITKRLPAARLHALVGRMVDSLLPLSLAIGRIPRVGRRLRYAVPIANYDGVLPLSRDQIREWALLDTFDMLAPAHDHPQSVASVRQWFEQAGLTGIEVGREGLVVGRARKP